MYCHMLVLYVFQNYVFIERKGNLLCWFICEWCPHYLYLGGEMLAIMKSYNLTESPSSSWWCLLLGMVVAHYIWFKKIVAACISPFCGLISFCFFNLPHCCSGLIMCLKNRLLPRVGYNSAGLSIVSSLRSLTGFFLLLAWPFVQPGFQQVEFIKSSSFDELNYIIHHPIVSTLWNNCMEC